MREIEIIHQRFSDGRQKLKKNNFMGRLRRQPYFKAIYETASEKLQNEIEYKQHHWHKRSNLRTIDIDCNAILQASINLDFSCRGETYIGECYFIASLKGSFFISTNRGMDVLGVKNVSIKSLYEEFNWILDYNRDEIDTVFT